MLGAALGGVAVASLAGLFACGLLCGEIPADRGLAVFVGLLLGGVVGGLMASRLRFQALSKADRLLPLLMVIVAAPLVLATTRVSDAVPGASASGWSRILLGLVLAGLLGVGLGLFWGLRERARPDPAIRTARWTWGGFGVLLGVMLASVVVVSFNWFPGSLLVNLFLAPIMWPLIPSSGPRSLLARMLLTVIVLLSFVMLLFAQ